MPGVGAWSCQNLSVDCQYLFRFEKCLSPLSMLVAAAFRELLSVQLLQPRDVFPFTDPRFNRHACFCRSPCGYSSAHVLKPRIAGDASDER